MKNFALGFLICALFYGHAARAIDIQMTNLTVRDLYAACALAGYCSRTVLGPKELAQASHEAAEAMMKYRK